MATRAQTNQTNQTDQTDTNQTDTSQTDTSQTDQTDIGHLPGFDLSEGLDIKELLKLTVEMMQAQPAPSTFGVELDEREKEALGWLRKQAGYDPTVKGRQPWKTYQRGYEKFQGQGPVFAAFEPKRQQKAGYVPPVCDRNAPESIKLLAGKRLMFTNIAVSRLKSHGMVKIGDLMILCQAIGYAAPTQTAIVDLIRKSAPFYKFRFDEYGELQLKPGETIPDFIGWKTFGEMYKILTTR